MKRIQRKRSKGWRMPENTKYVGRPGKWGNPIALRGNSIMINVSHRRKTLDPWVFYQFGNIDHALRIYSMILDGYQFINPDLKYWSDKFKEYDWNELKDKDFACWCRLDEPCHADILIKKIYEKQGTNAAEELAEKIMSSAMGTFNQYSTETRQMKDGYKDEIARVKKEAVKALTAFAASEIERLHGILKSKTK